MAVLETVGTGLTDGMAAEEHPADRLRVADSALLRVGLSLSVEEALLPVDQHPQLLEFPLLVIAPLLEDGQLILGQFQLVTDEFYVLAKVHIVRRDALAFQDLVDGFFLLLGQDEGEDVQLGGEIRRLGQPLVSRSHIRHGNVRIPG